MVWTTCYRVTASKLYSVLHTNQSQPPVSLIKFICYLEAVRFFSNTCTYGCKHEDDARSIYAEWMKMEHTTFSLKVSGLLLGPSPDGIVEWVAVEPVYLRSSVLIPGKINHLNKTEEQSFLLENISFKNAYYYHKWSCMV